MAQSITDKILAALTAALKAKAPDVGLTETNIGRSRLRPAELAELPLITLRPLTEHVIKATPNRNSPAVFRTLNVAVAVRCAGEDADLDPYRTFVIESVMSDMTCGGLVNEIEEAKHDWDGDGAAADADYAEDTITFAVMYQTARNTAVSK